jgi:hypothetical protein
MPIVHIGLEWFARHNPTDPACPSRESGPPSDNVECLPIFGHFPILRQDFGSEPIDWAWCVWKGFRVVRVILPLQADEYWSVATRLSFGPKKRWLPPLDACLAF